MKKENITIEDVKETESKLSPCPFCGVKPRIVICDDEGNIKRNPEEYIVDPWSGLSFSLIHPKEEKHSCPIATEKDDDIVLGNLLYDSLDELIESWNKRFSQKTGNTWFDKVSAIYLRLNEEDTYIPMTSMFVCSRLSYLRNYDFEEVISKLREEWKDGFDMRFVFKNGDINDYKMRNI